MNRLSLLTIAIVFASFNLSFAQFDIDRLSSNVSLLSTFGTTKDQSFWLTHNRWGIIDDESANALTILSSQFADDTSKLFSFSGGINLVGRASANSDIFFPQAYIEARLAFVHFKAGRKQTTYGIPLGDLSSGSTAISRNALPIPKLTVSIPDFLEIPYSYGWLEVRGHISHGWLESIRFVEDAYFHDKSVHFQTGGKTGLKFYWGLNHMAIWGGESEIHGKMPSSFRDFLLVAQADEGGDSAPTSDQLNALGFHTGVWDWGLKVDIGSIDIHLYYQHLFTDGSGQRYQNAGDGLFGVNIKNPFAFKWITGVTYEYLNTTDQSGLGLSDESPGATYPCDEPNCGYPYGGRDNYYSNGIYRSGYSYYNMSIGSPFFLTQSVLNKVDPSINTYSSRLFISTRNRAHHMGVNGDLSENFSYKLLLSSVRYYGTYNGLNQGTTWGILDPENNIILEDYFFYPYKKQRYFLLETKWQLKSYNKLQIKTSLAIDRGDLFNNIGTLLGVSWTFE